MYIITLILTLISLLSTPVFSIENGPKEGHHYTFNEVLEMDENILSKTLNFVGETENEIDLAPNKQECINNLVPSDPRISAAEKDVYSDLALLLYNGKKVLSSNKGSFSTWLEENLKNNTDHYYFYDPKTVSEKVSDGFLLRLNLERNNYSSLKKITWFNEKRVDEAIALFTFPGSSIQVLLFPNQYPYLDNHTLIIPEIWGHHPQEFKESFTNIALRFLDYFQDPKLKIGLSLKLQDESGEWQKIPIDNFHFQLFTNKLPVENEELFSKSLIHKEGETTLSKINGYPLDAFIFQGTDPDTLTTLITSFTKHLENEKIIYNLFFSQDPNTKKINCYVVIRNHYNGLGFLEACGCLRLITVEEFDQIKVAPYLSQFKLNVHAEQRLQRALIRFLLDRTPFGFENLQTISPLNGNSDAIIFKIQNLNANAEVIKMCSSEVSVSGQNKLIQEAKQLNILTGLFPNIYPNATCVVKDQTAMLKQSFLDGKTLETILLDTAISREHKWNLLQKSIDSLLSIYSHQTFPDSDNFLKTAHFQRVENRLKSAQKECPQLQDLFAQNEIVINGKCYPSPFVLLEKIQNDPTFVKILTPPVLGLCAHGDFIPSNIIISPEQSVKFIDVRGCNEADEYPRWDSIYDLSKLKYYLSSFKGISEGHFDLKNVGPNQFTLGFSDLSEHIELQSLAENFVPFLEGLDTMQPIIEIDPHWETRLLFGEAMHCLAETASRAKKGHGNQATAIYLQGIRLLTQTMVKLFAEKESMLSKECIDISVISGYEDLKFDLQTFTLFTPITVLATSERKVSNLNPQTYFHDPITFYKENDRLLYLAIKDFFAIRAPNDYKNQWRYDLTLYPGLPLLSGELNRSSGHKNGEHEIEIFQVWLGKVRIYFQVESNGQITPFYQDLNPGDYSIIPPGAWHSTHVLEGPAIVGNICNREGFFLQKNKPYTGEGAFTFFKDDRDSIQHAINPKYLHSVSNSPINIQPDQLSESLKEYKNLSDLYLNGTQQELEDLAQSIFSEYEHQRACCE